MAWITTIGSEAAQGELREVYQAMAARRMPETYRPPHGGTPGIIRAHSLDAGMVRMVFGVSGTLHAGEDLSWADRELLATVTSRTNQCFY